MTSARSRLLDATLAGLAGAVAMTVCHETARRLIPAAPRLDSLGRRGLARIYRGLGQRPPGQAGLQAEAIVGDLISNTGLFAGALLAGPPPAAPTRALVTSALAGWATLRLPPQLGIGPDPARLAPQTQGMTLGLYLLGGGVAALVYRARLRDAGDS